ncbi:WD40 repeat-like protein [Rickenella mellea]|uniref:WD40 repeat-like protein n=1 Tax=Rickenella mellea TaxID=50990 RepID=A0A4Y7PI06_9AGAM|nr:WD40 repeat-like protein [Rickenella mellea]
MHSAGGGTIGMTAAVDKANDGIGQLTALNDTWQPLLAKLKSFSDLVDKIAEVHPYAKMAWSVLSAAHKTILAQGDRDDRIQQLYKVMDSVYAIVLEAESSRIESHKPLVACMAHQTIECGYFITSYAKDKKFWMRLVKNAMTGADTAMENFQVKFQELKKQFHEEAIRNSEITVKHAEIIVASILDEVKNLVTEVDLKDMPYATDARFRSDKQCLAGTWEEILDEISDWINHPESSQNVFLLCGAAGTGKSPIAHTIAKRFDQLGHLAGPIVVVIDALDESGDPRSRHAVLSSLAKQAANLPANFRIFLTSRLEKDIIGNFFGNGSVIVKHMDDIENGTTERDIHTYICRQLSECYENFTEGDYQLLVNKSERIFQWAFVVCDSIKWDIAGSTPYERFQQFTLLRFRSVMGQVMTAFEPLSVNALAEMRYAANVDNLKSDSRSSSKNFVTSIVKFMGSLLSGVSDDFIPVRALHTSFRDFLTDPSRSGKYYVNKLPLDSNFQSKVAFLYRQLLYWLELTVTIRIWDAKIGIVTSPALKGHWGGIRCVTFSPDDKYILSACDEKTIQVWDAATSTSTTITLEQCDKHVGFVAFSPDGKQMVAGSTDNNIRVWNHIASSSWDKTTRVWDANTGAVTLGPLKGHTDGIWTSLVWNAEKGTVTFGPLRGHTDEVRCVAFSPNGKHIVSGSYDKTIQIWNMDSDVMAPDTGTIKLGPLQGHDTQGARVVAFSSDGKNIISGSDDEKNIQVWDTDSGMMTLSQTYCVCILDDFPQPSGTLFRPDFAINCDRRGWAVMPGLTGSQFTRKTSFQILSLEEGGDPLFQFKTTTSTFIFALRTVEPPRFLREVTHYHGTIHVWDANTGTEILGPLEGHTSNIMSIAFSPDGKHILSGSNDNTIQMWNADTGLAVWSPLEGHSGYVNFVAFSNDGKYIVSGSDDETIQMWDADTGLMMANTLHLDLMMELFEF